MVCFACYTQKSVGCGVGGNQANPYACNGVMERVPGIRRPWCCDVGRYSFTREWKNGRKQAPAIFAKVSYERHGKNQ